MKILVVIDAQNDFIDGALGSEAAKQAVPNVIKRIKEYESLDEDYFIIFTKDTHFMSSYLRTQEGQKLPVPHCIYETEGWQINKDIDSAVTIPERTTCLQKTKFSSNLIPTLIGDEDEVEICGFATDIRVITNALLIKAHCPEVKITLDPKCCAGTSKEAHEAALKVMKSCQIEVLE